MSNEKLTIHIVMHEVFEAPGAVETWARRNGHRLLHTRLYEGDQLPSDETFDMLVIMGGPQSPATTVNECAHFDAAAETALIKRAIDSGKLVFGVCLGAQLIGEALGARYEHSPQREMGVFPVTLTKDGKLDPIVGKLPSEFMVGHWHGDMPGLTSDARVLASSEGCPRQIVRYTPKVYGFQCHFEFDSQVIELAIEHCADELDHYADLQYVESAEQLRAHEYDSMNALLFEFLEGFTK